MTASLTENSFPSTRCHYELNVSSTWWIDLSAKIYFDQVSAPFCVTPWLSPFLSSFPSFCHLLFFKSVFLLSNPTPYASVFSCHTVDKHDVLQWSVSPSPEPCVSESVCVCVHVSVCVYICAHNIDSGFTQSDSQAEWLIGALQSDLRQGEHTQSYSSRSNSSTITGPLIWVMLYRLPCMRGQEQRRGWFDT